MNHFKTSLSYYWYEESFSMRRLINGIFYFLRKIPLIGKHIPVSIYKNYELKQIIFILVFIGNVLLKFGAKFLWYGISAGVAVFLNSMFDWDVSGLVCWFFLTPLIWRFFEGFMQMLDKNQLSFVQNFQLSPKLFIEMDQSVDLFSHVIAYLPVWLIFTYVAGGSYWLPISLLASYVGFAWLFYYLNRFLITLNLMVRSFIGWAYVVIVLAGLMLFSWQVPGATQLAILGHPLFALGMIALAGLSYRLLFNYPGEEVYVNRLMSKSAEFDTKYSTTNQTTNTYLGEGLKMQKEMTLDEKDYSHLKGGRYLNAVLFNRYRKTLNKQLRRRLLGILVAAVAVIVLVKFVPTERITESLVLKLLPILFFAMYGLTFGKKVVQLVFINCDSSMLYYPFYRERQTILQGFMYRFWQTFKLNGILSLALFLGFVGLHVFNGFFLSASFFLVLAFLLISLSFLFSFHELFVYYILQPFTSDLDVVNPVYKFVTMAFYWVAYMNLQIRASGFVYVVGLATVSIIYVAIGLIVIFMIAPKTFRFKG